MTADSMSRWISELKKGDGDAARQIWIRCFSQLIRHARDYLAAAPCRVSDEEDVVQNVFLSLCRGAEAGRFPKLNDRSDLWQILTMLTHQKVVDGIRCETRKKRGGGRVRTESVFLNQNGSQTGFAQIASEDLGPEYLVELSENLQHLLSRLGSESVRQVARYRLEGYSICEIAATLGITTRSVERKLRQIRAEWAEPLGLDLPDAV